MQGVGQVYIVRNKPASAGTLGDRLDIDTAAIIAQPDLNMALLNTEGQFNAAGGGFGAALGLDAMIHRVAQ